MNHSDELILDEDRFGSLRPIDINARIDIDMKDYDINTLLQ